MLQPVRLLAMAAAFAASMIAGTAHAVPVLSTETFAFSGQCGDCAGTATATLTLTNYTQGNAITSANFVSFTYNGTNLLSPFTIRASDLSFIDGTIPLTLPAAAFFDVLGQNFGENFRTRVDGNGFWCAGSGNCASDQGTNAIWAVPEPLSSALLGSSLLILAVARRRRARASQAS